MKNGIPLGAAAPEPVAIMKKPVSLAEEVKMLKSQVEELTKAFNNVCRIRLKESRQHQVYAKLPTTGPTRPVIPPGTAFYGDSYKNGPAILLVRGDGYYIGQNKYESLSAAAEVASGVRRSGWTFWKLPDGRTAKEAFGKR
jgi:hypothetical protein